MLVRATPIATKPTIDVARMPKESIQNLHERSQLSNVCNNTLFHSFVKYYPDNGARMLDTMLDTE